MPGRPRRRHGLAAYLALVAIPVFALIVLIPFALVIINAAKPPAQYASHWPLSLPHGFDTTGIRAFLGHRGFRGTRDPSPIGQVGNAVGQDARCAARLASATSTWCSPATRESPAFP